MNSPLLSLQREMSQPLDLAAIKLANPIVDVIGASIPLKRAGREFVALCPFHSEKSPSFTIVPDKGFAHCFGCGWSGDQLDFICTSQGIGLREAGEMLAGGVVPVRPTALAAAIAQPDRSKEARAIWQMAEKAPGSPVEAYLAMRAIRPPFPPDIGFARLPCANLGPLPCLVAAVRNVEGDVMGIQRIWLAHDGLGKADIDKPKRSLGRIKGGAIRLGELDGTGCVTVCEGPEDGLSLLEMLGGPVWVAAGATFLPAMQFPPEVRSIVIGADNDPAGENAAREAAHAFTIRGLSVRIIRPLEDFKDFNDELRGAR
jgi:DNA primase